MTIPSTFRPLSENNSEVTPDRKTLSPKQRAALLGAGGAAIVSGSALAWGMSRDGLPNPLTLFSHVTPESDLPDEQGELSDEELAMEAPNGSIEPGYDTPNAETVVPGTTPDLPRLTIEEASQLIANLDMPESGDMRKDAIDPSSPSSGPYGANPNAPGAFVPAAEEVVIATDISDELSFSDAFAAARSEVGPGGYFEWRGELFNTFYREEWESMSTAEQRAYADAVHRDLNGGEHASPEVHEGTLGDHHLMGINSDEDPELEVIVVDGNQILIDTNDDGRFDRNSTLSAEDAIRSDEPTETPPSPTITWRPAEFHGHHLELGNVDEDNAAELVIVDDAVVFADTDGNNTLDARGVPGQDGELNWSPLAGPVQSPLMEQPADTTSPPEPFEPQVEVEVQVVNGHEFVLGDQDGDQRADVVVVDGAVAFVDLDQDGMLDMGGQLNPESMQVEEWHRLEQPIEAPLMHSEEAVEEVKGSDDLYTSTDQSYGGDFDNQADTSEFV